MYSVFTSWAMARFPNFQRWHSSTVFTLIVLCFLLSFATVSFVGGCSYSGHGQTSFTGMQLVTRMVPEGTGTGNCPANITGESPYTGGAINSCVERAGATSAEIAFGAAVVGLVLGLLGVAGGPGYCAAVGVGALLQLFLSLGDYQVSPHAGYWIALSLFGWAGILHVRRWWVRRPTRVGGRYRPLVSAGVLLLALFSLVFGFRLGLWLPPLLFASWAGIRQLTQHEERPSLDGEP
jgi:hypothetical protein